MAYAGRLGRRLELTPCRCGFSELFGSAAAIAVGLWAEGWEGRALAGLPSVILGPDPETAGCMYAGAALVCINIWCDTGGIVAAGMAVSTASDA